MDRTVLVKEVSLAYGSKQVLRQVNFSVAAGQIYGLIGPSGAGKTTLVKLLVGMEVPDQGTVDVLGRRVPNLELLQEIGYMAQSDALYTELTGAENLKFFASLFKLGKAEQTARIAYAADLVKLSQELGKKVGAYSGGMKRRLSLAIALIQNPKLLILDEPTVGIDPELRLQIWNELIRLKEQEGKTILVTTHVMDEAARCDRLTMVREGEIIADGTPSELMSRYAVDNLEGVFLQAGGSHR